MRRDRNQVGVSMRWRYDNCAIHATSQACSLPRAKRTGGCLRPAQCLSYLYEVDAIMWFGVYLVTGRICTLLPWVSGYRAIKEDKMGLVLSRAKGIQYKGKHNGVNSSNILLIDGTCFTNNGGMSLKDVNREEEAYSGYVRTRRKVFQCDAIGSRYS